MQKKIMDFNQVKMVKLEKEGDQEEMLLNLVINLLNGNKNKVNNNLNQRDLHH